MRIRRSELDRDAALTAHYESYSHIGQVLASKSSDYERYRYCRERSEQCRNEWFENERQYILAALRPANAQFRGMSPKLRVVHAKIRWQKSIEAQEIIGDEQMWTRWAQMYQTAVMMNQLAELNGLLRTLTRRPTQPTALTPEKN